jgi:vesicle-associated membrane protein 2
MAEPESKDPTTNAEKSEGESDLPKPSANVSAASRRFQQTQAQVDEVVGIMRTNVEKVLERDTKLSELVSCCQSIRI